MGFPFISPASTHQITTLVLACILTYSSSWRVAWGILGLHKEPDSLILFSMNGLDSHRVCQSQQSCACDASPTALAFQLSQLQVPRSLNWGHACRLLSTLKYCPVSEAHVRLFSFTVDARGPLGQDSACMARCVQVRSCMQKSPLQTCWRSRPCMISKAIMNPPERQASQPCACRWRKLGLK